MFYSVKKLAKLAGVSIRTLHLYDKMGLLKPAVRTDTRYRMYGEKELFRLQQILFYRELEMPLKEIAEILNRTNFNLISSLETHKSALELKQKRLLTMLETIDKTIIHLKNKEIMLSHEELYEGFGLSKAQGEAYRKEAAKKWGEVIIEKSDSSLRKLTKVQIADLKTEQQAIGAALFVLSNQDPTSPQVQEQIARHYANIRRFWGTSGTSDKQAAAYTGLGRLYLSDERYTIIEGKSQPAYCHFLCKAMEHFAETMLK